MGTFFSVLVAVGAAALVLPRVLRRSPQSEPSGDDKAIGNRSQAKTGGVVVTTESPSRRFITTSPQRVGKGGQVPPERLRDGSSGTWKPEMGGGFHQTTAYPEPPAPYELAEEQTRSGSRPAAKQATTSDGVSSPS